MLRKKRLNIKAVVFEYLEKHPKITKSGLKKVFPQYNIQTLRMYKRDWERWHGRYDDLIYRLEKLLELFKTKMQAKKPLSQEDWELIIDTERMVKKGMFYDVRDYRGKKKRYE